MHLGRPLTLTHITHTHTHTHTHTRTRTHTVLPSASKRPSIVGVKQVAHTAGACVCVWGSWGESVCVFVYVCIYVCVCVFVWGVVYMMCVCVCVVWCGVYDVCVCGVYDTCVCTVLGVRPGGVICSAQASSKWLCH